MKKKFVILLVKRMLGLDKEADGSKMEVSDVAKTWKGLGDLTGQAEVG